MAPNSPVSSFLRFLTGFLLFLSLSFGITFAVHTYTTKKDAENAAAAAKAQMLQQR